MTAQKANLLLSGAVCVLLGVLIALVIVTGKTAKVEDDTAAAEIEADKITVQTRRAIPSGSFTVRRDYSGIIQAARKLDLGFSRSGRVVAVHAEVGDRVEEGDLLAELDIRRLELQEAAYENAITRQRSNRGPPSGTPITPTDLEMVKMDIEDSQLRAPFDAVVTTRLTSVGALASPGHPAFQIIERDHIEAMVSVPVDVAESMTEDEVHELLLGDRSIEGEVAAVLPEVDMTTRTRTVVFRIAEEKSADISPGAVVKLRLERVNPIPGYWLPLSSLTRELRGLWSVYEVREDEEGGDEIVRRYIEVIHVEGDRAWVRGTGSEEFDYIAKGVHRVVPGQRVKVKGKVYEETEGAETSPEDAS